MCSFYRFVQEALVVHTANYVVVVVIILYLNLWLPM